MSPRIILSAASIAATVLWLFTLPALAAGGGKADGDCAAPGVAAASAKPKAASAVVDDNPNAPLDVRDPQFAEKVGLRYQRLDPESPRAAATAAARPRPKR